MARYRVTEKSEDHRLDKFIVTRLPKVSRAFIQKLAKQGKVLVNNIPEKVSYKVRKGDSIKVDYIERSTASIPKIQIPILYEDENVVVINKPPGLLVHSKGVFNPEPTVASWLEPKTDGLSGNRPGIVHRLDRATSGVMICAKNAEALSMLQKQFSQRRVKKIYKAVVLGTIDPLEAVIEMPIERNPKSPATFRAGFSGKPAITQYKVIQSNATYSLVKLLPTTGRTHQLRVHLAKINHPILGDSLYKGEKADRLYLHAESLELTLPGGMRKVFRAKLPQEFNKVMEEK